MTGRKKRNLPVGEEEPGQRRSKRIHGAQESGRQESPESELVPFDIPDDMSVVNAENVLSWSKAFSEELYAQDLWAIFSTAANAGRPEHIAMHKVWLKCRNPTIEELWASRYPTSGTYKASFANKVLRIVLTIQKMTEKADEPALVRRLQTLEMDYIMLMCLSHTDMNKPNFYFPGHEEQFYALVESLGDGQSEAPRVEAADSRKPTGFIVPAAKRTLFENLRVDASTVTSMHQISGYEHVKREIKAAVLIPTEAPYFASRGIVSNGILLYGAPGTGKTLLAMSIAALDAKCATFKVSSSNLVVKWVGESEQNVESMFAVAAENSPSVIIIDEIDSLCQNRDSGTTATEGSSQKITNTFLEKMTQYKNVCVIATTNLPWQLDSAILRRFGEKLYVGLPSKSVRVDIIRPLLQPFDHALKEDDMIAFADYCEGFTGAAVVDAFKSAMKDLVMEMLEATHFQQVKVNGQDRFCPCTPQDGGIERTYRSFEKREGVDSPTTRPLTLEMLCQAAKRLEPWMQKSKADDEKARRWSEGKFGH